MKHHESFEDCCCCCCCCCWGWGDGPCWNCTEYPPLWGSCCSLKLSVDRPNGRRTRFPRSFNLPVIVWTDLLENKIFQVDVILYKCGFEIIMWTTMVWCNEDYWNGVSVKYVCSLLTYYKSKSSWVKHLPIISSFIFSFLSFIWSGNLCNIICKK